MKSSYIPSIFLLVFFQFTMIGILQAQNISSVLSWDNYMESKTKAEVKAHIRNLAFDNVSSLYPIEGSFSQSGNTAPVRIFTNAKDLSMLNTPNKLFNGVEMIVVKLSNAEDVSNLKSNGLTFYNNFQNLKYVFFIIETDNISAELNGFFSTLTPTGNIQLFYQVSIAN